MLESDVELGRLELEIKIVYLGEEFRKETIELQTISIKNFLWWIIISLFL